MPQQAFCHRSLLAARPDGTLLGKIFVQSIFLFAGLDSHLEIADQFAATGTGSIAYNPMCVLTFTHEALHVQPQMARTDSLTVMHMVPMGLACLQMKLAQEFAKH